MTPEEIIAQRVEAHRERVQREMDELKAEREALYAKRGAYAGFRAKRKKGKPRRSSSSASQMLVELLDRLNIKARNPGYSLP
jgi:hypothetical protein